MAHKSKRIEILIEGKPSVLVQHGRDVIDNMNQERVTLECDGRLSFVPEEDEQGNPTQSVEKEID